MEIVEQPREEQPEKESYLPDGTPMSAAGISVDAASVVSGQWPVVSDVGDWQPSTTGSQPPAPHSVPSRPASGRFIDRSADLLHPHIKPHWVQLCFTITFAVYLALIPQLLRFSNPPTGDQVFYLMDTASLAQDFDLNVANNYDNVDEAKFYQLAPKPDGYVGMQAPFPLPRQLVNSTARPKEEQYSFHLPGLPVLMAPAWWLGSFFSLWWPATIVVMCLIGALVAVNVFLLSYEVTGRLWIAWVVWLACAFSVPLMIYSYMIFTELPAGLLLIYAFRRLALGWRSNRPWRLLLVGLCIAYIPWLAWRCLPLSVCLLVYAFVQWRRAQPSANDGRWTMDDGSKDTGSPPAGAHTPSSIVHRLSSGTRRLLPTAYFLVPALISAVAIVGYNLYLFGRPVPDNKVPELGDLPPFNWPWLGVDEATQFAKGAFALFYDQQFGLLPYTPVYLLAAVGIIVMFRWGREYRRLLYGISFVALPYLAVIMAFHFWDGIWCPPARYLTTLLPMMAAPLAMSLFAFAGTAMGWLYKTIFAALTLFGLAVSGLLMSDSRQLWPVPNPAFYSWLANSDASPLHIDLRPLLANFSAPDIINHPLTSAWLVGMSLMLLAFCYLLLVLQGKQWGEGRLALPAQGLVWLGLLTVIGLGWGAMNYPYLKPKTILTLLHRWDFESPIYQGYGIAYYDGKVYIASYGKRQPSGDSSPGELGELDPSTGKYTVVHPTSSQGAVAILHPSEVKVGPDGLLYVLNNGEALQAMYVLNSRMEVVRQEALNNRSPVSLGLSFGPDQMMYVADMVGGKVLRYNSQGGMPLNSWGGMNSNYNNVAGVTVAPDGMIYSLESSYQRVQQFDARGRFIRKYPVGCIAMYAAIDGDWMDVTCTTGFKSINLKDNYVQLARSPDGPLALHSPTGLAYAPDHTLFVLDGNSLFQFKVEH
ncbi:MAG: hypothetical protein ACJ78Q_02615 [Chloroflexia bacterium]